MLGVSVEALSEDPPLASFHTTLMPLGGFSWRGTMDFLLFGKLAGALDRPVYADQPVSAFLSQTLAQHRVTLSPR